MSSVWLSAPINALVEGIYRGQTTVEEVLRHGDFGLGTFDALDGEMVVLDGRVHQLRADCRAHPVPPGTRTPFACVTAFKPFSEETVEGPLDHAALEGLLERALPSPNSLFALRVDGRFSHVHVRSVPPQADGRPLVEVTRTQSEATFSEVEGTLAGFWTPPFLSAVSVPGWHLHFLTADRSAGGHLLGCAAERITLRMQHAPRLELELPVTLDYLTQRFGRDVEADLDEAEKARQ